MNRFFAFRQLFHFGVVGTMAAAVHMTIVIGLVEYFAFHPLIANILAFSCAFNISYFGHRYLTFAKAQTKHSSSLPKFFMVASASFAANEGLFYLALKVMPYTMALFMVLLGVAIGTFSISKVWAFK